MNNSINREDQHDLNRMIKQYGSVTILDYIVDAMTEESKVPNQTADALVFQQMPESERELAERAVREQTESVRCSFCGKKREQVENIIAGPNVFICIDCVGLCNEIIEKGQEA